MTDRGFNRRRFLGGGAALAATAALPATTRPAGAAAESGGGVPPRKFHLGMVTYNMGREMDVPTLIETCKAAGIEGVELRTTHKHGVEPTIGADKRREVRKRFEDSSVALWGLGTTCEFHSTDAAQVRRQIKICGDFCKLAKDVGARGIKVRPNGLPKGVPVEKTLEQIGKSLIECGKVADDHGVEIWVEVHGRGTSHAPNMRTIMDHCGHPRVGACWNSNSGNVKDGSVREYFELLGKYLKSCHITEIYNPRYPYRELFTLMRQMGYDRFTLAEIPGSSDPVRVMKYYRGLWAALSS